MRKFLLLGWFCSLVACSLLASRPPEHPQVTALISGPPSISVVIDGPQSLTVCDIIPIRYVLNPFQEQLQVADTVVFRHPTSAV